MGWKKIVSLEAVVIMGYGLSIYLRNKRNYEKRKKAGICTRCDNKAEPNKTLCAHCGEKNRLQSIRNYEHRKKRWGYVKKQEYYWFCTNCDKIFKTEPKTECCKGFMILKIDREDLEEMI